MLFVFDTWKKKILQQTQTVPLAWMDWKSESDALWIMMTRRQGAESRSTV